MKYKIRKYNLYKKSFATNKNSYSNILKNKYLNISIIIQ